ncbi:unnamed protein product [Plutella xylostella]|uniref:(diamondback moth) hypothetical protein n=1 Tax=Plutella xylostella TaxID=51655 RepID=A0A8S4E956_PLUXY|nr:unnamed protein product [Plutella xylostella]
MSNRLLVEEEEDVLAPKEPQVLSEDPAERKEARALRIKRRQEAIKRQVLLKGFTILSVFRYFLMYLDLTTDTFDLADQPPEDAAADEEPSLIEQATAAAAEELQRLTLGGAGNVTNIKVTTDEREVFRRAIFNNRMRSALERIENEATEAQEQYEAVTGHWGEMSELKDPLDIDAAMKEQKAKCDDLLERKNQVISDIKEFLKDMDVGYYEDLDKQDQDIKELSERIEKQLSMMQKAYEQQLGLIEQAISIERDAMMDHNNKRWEALYKQRDKEEVAHMEFKEEQLEQHKEEIERIMWEHHEKYREAKIHLEHLIQELQKELEKMKATCLINTEKIGYNYQILKKREEENVFVRSQQKRKLNKMADVANALRAKIRKAAQDGIQEEMRADAEISKLMQAMDELEKKSYHFSQVNDYKFSQVWRMSAARCSALARRLRQAEVAIHAHVLAEPAPPPPPPPPVSPLKVKHDAESEKKVSNSQALAMPEANFGPISDPNNALENECKDRLVRHILGLVADNTGFLIEDRLFTLIEKYNQCSRNLCTLDAIFMALEIRSEEDIRLLCRTFIKYAFCPACSGADSSEELIESTATSDQDLPSMKHSRGDKSSLRSRGHGPGSASASHSRSMHAINRSDLTHSDQELLLEADEILQKVGDCNVDQYLQSPSLGSVGARRRGVTVAAAPVADDYTSPYMCPSCMLIYYTPPPLFQRLLSQRKKQ